MSNQCQSSKFKIDESDAAKRLDKFLKEQHPDFSRAFLQKAIQAGQVLVNGKKTAVHFFLKIGDEVEIKIQTPKEIEIKANPAVEILPKCPTSLRQAQGILPERSGAESKACLIHEEPNFLVINKPAGLVVHQAEGHKEPDTLVNGLLARYPEIAKVGDDLLRPGIVHRLDKEASGVMVVARTQTMFDHLKSQFKLRQTKKEYLALVYGQVSPPQGTIEFALEKKGAKMVARAKGGGGKEAMTEYEVIAPSPQSPPIKGVEEKTVFSPLVGRGGNLTLLRLITHTGRTHQIRVHLFALGHPIVGDKLYSLSGAERSRRALRQAQGIISGRLMLHAQKLGFYDLAEKWREFEAPTPQEFKFM
ncbi:MAG: RluA family pseudouridine synthase [bacterium]|nr:RluA family pseudouridine synthase [bacterium]